MVRGDAFGIQVLQVLDHPGIEADGGLEAVGLAIGVPVFFFAKAQDGREIEQGWFLLGHLQRLVVAAFLQHGGDAVQPAFCVRAKLRVGDSGLFHRRRRRLFFENSADDLDGVEQGFHGLEGLGVEVLAAAVTLSLQSSSLLLGCSRMRV